MKKLISGMTALTLAGLMCITAFAQAAPENTTIKPKGDVNGEFVVDPDPNTADTTIEFKVNPDYTVTIPATVTLTGRKGEKYTGSGEIKA